MLSNLESYSSINPLSGIKMNESLDSFRLAFRNSLNKDPFHKFSKTSFAQFNYKADLPSSNKNSFLENQPLDKVKNINKPVDHSLTHFNPNFKTENLKFIQVPPSVDFSPKSISNRDFDFRNNFDSAKAKNDSFNSNIINCLGNKTERNLLPEEKSKIFNNKSLIRNEENFLTQRSTTENRSIKEEERFNIKKSANGSFLLFNNANKKQDITDSSFLPGKNRKFLNNSNNNITMNKRENQNIGEGEKYDNIENKKNSMEIPNYEPSKVSNKKNGVVKAYAANTNMGLVRKYNEDRVSIILNITKPNGRDGGEWEKSSFFAIYDGHGGTACADFLRDHLHQFVIKDSNFPSNPKEALKNGFREAEQIFVKFAQKNGSTEYERSGSCAIVLLIIGDVCYIANVGDSRAVMSCEGGIKICPLSKDHKPFDESEYKRIVEAGGRVYQTKFTNNTIANNGQNDCQTGAVVGPYRVLPGRLSVARTFGDIEAKLERFGGNPSVVIAEPEIRAFKISEKHDFIILGSDGIFDKLSSKEAISTVWKSASSKKFKEIHELSAFAVDSIMKESVLRKTTDNITVVIISFSAFKRRFFPKKSNSGIFEEQFKKPESLEKKTSSIFIEEKKPIFKTIISNQSNNHRKIFDEIPKKSFEALKERSYRENDRFLNTTKNEKIFPFTNNNSGYNNIFSAD